MYADTRELELTITAQVGPQAHPIQLIADLVKAGTNASIQLKQW